MIGRATYFAARMVVNERLETFEEWSTSQRELAESFMPIVTGESGCPPAEEEVGDQNVYGEESQGTPLESLTKSRRRWGREDSHDHRHLIHEKRKRERLVSAEGPLD